MKQNVPFRSNPIAWVRSADSHVRKTIALFEKRAAGALHEPERGLSQTAAREQQGDCGGCSDSIGYKHAHALRVEDNSRSKKSVHGRNVDPISALESTKESRSPLSLSTFLCGLLVFGSASLANAQDHGHLNVGAVGTNQNDALVFDEGEIFATTNDYVKTLLHTNSGRFAGYFQGNITLTALSATPGHSAFSPNAPSPGSWIFGGITEVHGPAGGEFGFWDTGSTSPTVSVLCGTTNTNLWRLTEADGSPGTDPYGHIHGRRFTATKPGIYVVSFRAVDLSTNGVNGGPIHTPSEILSIHFQAGDNIQSVEMQPTSKRIRFAAQAGYAWQVEARTLDESNVWTPVGEAVLGDDYFHEVADSLSGANGKLYRTKGTAVLP